MTPEVCGQLLLGPRGALGLLAVGGGVTARLGRTERMAWPATAEAPGRMGGRVVGWMTDGWIRWMDRWMDEKVKHESRSL